MQAIHAKGGRINALWLCGPQVASDTDPGAPLEKKLVQIGVQVYCGGTNKLFAATCGKDKVMIVQARAHELARVSRRAWRSGARH